jgi:hypothetical protein
MPPTDGGSCELSEILYKDFLIGLFAELASQAALQANDDAVRKQPIAPPCDDEAMK